MDWSPTYMESIIKIFSSEEQKAYIKMSTENSQQQDEINYHL